MGADRIRRVLAIAPSAARACWGRWRVLHCLVFAVALAASLAGAAQGQTSRQARPAAQVHLFRGIFGTDGGISEIRNEILRRGITATAYNPGEGDGLAQALVSNEAASGRHVPVVLIGYSLGGQGVIALSHQLGQAGVPVDLLVILDAPSPLPVPGNVRQALNFYQTRAGTWRGRPVEADASFRGRLVNTNLDWIPAIDHYNVGRQPQVIGPIVRQVLQTVGRAAR